MKTRQGLPLHELNDKYFRALIENAHEAVVLYNVYGKIVFASKSLRRICGYHEQEVIGRSGEAFIHREDKEHARAVFLELLSKPGKRAPLIHRLRHKKGHYIWAESLLTNFSHVPEINGIVSNFRDITEKKLAEEKIFQTRELLQTITRNLSEGIFMGVLDSKLIYVNDAFLNLFGYRSFREIEDVKSTHFYADQKQCKKIESELKQLHVMNDVETLFRKKNGEIFWAIMNVRLLDHEGKENYFVGTVRDITKEKKAERELIESRTFLNNIISTAAAPIFVKDARHRWVMFNQKFIDLVGIPGPRLLGKTDKDFLSPEEAKLFWKIDNQVLKTGKNVLNEEKITSRSGEVHDVITVKSLYVNEKREKFVIGFVTEITHLRKTEEKIHQLNANLQGVLESTKESVYAVDKNFNYLIFNQNHKRIMKALYGADIRAGMNKLKFLERSVDSPWVEAELTEAMKGRHFASEHYLDYPKFKGCIRTTFNPIYDRDGEVRGVAVFVDDITQRKQFEEIIRSVNANLTAVMESTADRIIALDTNFRYTAFNKAHERLVKKYFKKTIRIGSSFLDILPPEIREFTRADIERALHGEQFLKETSLHSGTFLEIAYNPIYNSQQKINGVALFVRDVTERKRIENELKRLNEELTYQNTQLAAQEEELKATLEELSERNFELDQIMYKTSHDLRSPLSSIMGLVNLARMDKSEEHQEDYLTKIEDRIKKLDEFIRSMLDYARVNRIEVSYEKIDLKAVALNCIRELEYLENFNAVNATIKINRGDAFMTTDPLLINIIFSNIISNAYKYYNQETDSYLKIKINIGKDHIGILFEDNGIGIRSEHVGKIFNMFYRATERSQGSGLGMYIVQQAVEKLGGVITVSSEYGHGTKILIQLPIPEH
jgi:PAS domain S-box-containing protein